MRLNFLSFAFDQAFSRAHAHQVARLVGRQAMRRVRHDALHFFFRLADADTANGIAGQVHLDQRVGLAIQGQKLERVISDAH